jgi:hypothetical protein
LKLFNNKTNPNYKKGIIRNAFFILGNYIMKKTTYYFSHDYNAANDVKVLFLRQQLGMEGYGIYWYLIEQLAQSGGILPLNITPVLAMQMQVTEVKVLAVIKEFNLFTITEQTFQSERLLNHLQLRKKLSDKGREGALNRWGNSTPNAHPIDIPNAKESKPKKINNGIGRIKIK